MAAPAMAATDDSSAEASGAEVAAASAEVSALAPPPVGEGRFDVLVFSKTAGFRHGSIEEGIAAIELLGEENDFSVTATEDAAVFSEAGLAPFETVVFLSTTGDVLNASQEAAFEAYIEGGGGFAGIHSASDTEYGWEFYGDLVGAYFLGHPANQTATVVVEDPAHPSTDFLPTEWSRFDEWYSFQTNPRDDVHVLATLDETSYNPGTSNRMGADHPIAWCQEVEAGRAWYTALGHTEESYVEAEFLQHVLGGIETSAGVVSADCTATLDGSFERVALDENTQNPMEIDVADDGRVFYIERDGRVQVIETNGQVRTVLNLDVTTVQEFGLVGIVLDPDFAENGWVYLYYSPGPSTSPADLVSRFTMGETSIDPASEEVILQVPVQRAQCCHAGGALEFDTQGNLYIATGDNTNPFESQGYTPTDERAGRAAYDAQRTSGNTNSLSGKILRITPQDDGTYTIPDGNLFEPGTDLTRPEIYGMGFRNPFRIGIDPLTDKLMVGDYGPDAGAGSAARGPDGRVEWSILVEPGNYGWPYCHGTAAYIDWNFATNTGSGLYDCDSPVNDSPNNTGLTELPPVIEPQIWYGRQSTSAYPGIGTGGAPMAGPAYVYDPDLESDRKWPEYFSDKALFGEWNTGQLYNILLAEDRLSPVKVTEFLPRGTIIKPMAWEWGPDGALYILDWGSGFGGNNADSGVYRIDYTSGARAAIVQVSADVTSGPVPLEVQFSSEGTRDPNGGALTFAWDLDGDGTVDSTDPNPSFTYETAGAYQALLTVTTEGGRVSTATVNIAAGNTRPTVEITGPPAGGFTEFGDTVAYSVEVTDPEDDAAGVDTCPGVLVKPALGHNDHGHPGEQSTGCEGSFVATIDDSHGPEADIFVIVEADYTDEGGANGAPALTGSDIITLQPKTKQAEYFESTGRTDDATGGGDAGVTTEATSDDAGGFENLGFIEDGDYVSYSPVNFTGIDGVTVRAASPGDGGLVELRWNAPDGELLGTVDVAGTGDWQDYEDFSTDLADLPTETGELFVVFKSRDGGDGSLMNVNWFEFEGKGVSLNSAPTLESVTATPSSGQAPLAVTLAAEVSDLDGDDVTGVWTTGIAGDQPREGLTTDAVYTEPGTYTATFRATDSQGAFRVRTVEIEVESEPLTPCFGAKSDDFEGDSLDTDRWEVVRPDGNIRFEDGAIVIPTSATDIYQNTNTTTNIVLQPLEPGAFQATTKVTMAAREQYQQAGLVLYGTDDNYVKMVIQGRTASPDAAGRVFQLLRETDGVAQEWNTANLGTAYPDTYWVRLTSTNGTDVTASYSSDGETFTDMGQTVSLSGITNPRIGLLSLTGGGQEPVVDAAFDSFTITPDDSAGPVSVSDEFDGSELDTCRWQVVRPEPSALTVSDGVLRILTPNGDIYTNGNPETVSNFVLQDAPEGDWTVETKVDTTALVQQYQQGGLIAWVDDDNYVKFDHLVTSALGAANVASSVELRSEIAGAIQNPQPSSGAVARGEVWLRLTKTGSTFTGEYSLDGTTWVAVGGTTGVPNAAIANSDDLKVGVFTIGTNQAARVPVTFDYFRLLGEEEPDEDTTAPEVSATVEPAEQPAEGYTGPVTVTLTATDDSQATGGVVYTEYRLDGGDWTEYTAPVTVDPEVVGYGEHTFEYRASDASGNVSEIGSITMLFDEPEAEDTEAPSVDVTLDPAEPNGDNGWYTSAITVTVTADDGEGSGVETIEYQVVPAAQAGTWDEDATSTYTEPVTIDDDGEWALHVRATDAAGNTSAPVVVPFNIDTTAPEVSVDGVEDGATYGSSEVLELELVADDATSGVADSGLTLDGEPVDGPVELWLLEPGEHVLVGTATDVAGSATEVTVTFTVEVTFDDVETIVGYLVEAGSVPSRTGDQMVRSLERIEKLAADGKTRPAQQQLATLVRTAERGVSDEDARGILVEQLTWLSESLPTGSVPGGSAPGKGNGGR
ncbi:ThuA domain-containing protein [Aquipuribacter sp. SD81]|uniref:ThuA domain-containing protein n=1 Tax=Aquipuribacter sp. SD81 TaxID=3127703 RepID=UPI003017BCB8